MHRYRHLTAVDTAESVGDRERDGVCAGAEMYAADGKSQETPQIESKTIEFGGGEVHYYLIRAENSCGEGPIGDGRTAPTCPPPDTPMASTTPTTNDRGAEPGPGAHFMKRMSRSTSK